jgi:hypothetical protein
LIAANFVIFIVLGAIAAVYSTGIYVVSFSYGGAFEVWVSISLAIDTAIAGIMIWSVREI